MIEALGGIAALLSVSYIVDQGLLSTKSKDGLSRLLLQIDRANFAEYVANLAISFHKLLFTSHFFSAVFFFRSLFLTIVFAALSLLFIYIQFNPDPFVPAISVLLGMSAGLSISIATVVVPILVFIVMDYFSNGQTRLFLEVVKGYPRLSSFFLMAYSDLVVTFSLSILGLTLAYVAFSFMYFSTNTPVEIMFGFGEEISSEVIEDKYVEQYIEEEKQFGQLYGVPVWIVKGEVDEELERLDLNYIENNSDFNVVYEDDEKLVQFLNDRGVVSRYFRVSYESEFIGGAASWSEFCHLLSEPAESEFYRINLLRGPDKNQFVEDCIDKKTGTYSYVIEVNRSEFSFLSLATNVVGDAISLSFNTLAAELGYLALPITRTWNTDGYWQNTPMQGDSMRVNEIQWKRNLERAWALHHGLYRVYVNGGYLWSTLFVATLMTSLISWLTVVFAVVSFPFILLIEKTTPIAGSSQIKQHPITYIAMILCVVFGAGYSLLVWF